VFPAPHESTNPILKREFYGSGDVKTAYTETSRLGDSVARIIDDPRTLNKTAQTWDGETTLREAWEIPSKVSGENFDDYPRVRSWPSGWYAVELVLINLYVMEAFGPRNRIPNRCRLLEHRDQQACTIALGSRREHG